MEEQHAAIVAVITMKQESIQGGGAPVFIVENEELLQSVSSSIAKIMDCSAHEIDEYTMIVVAR